MKKVFFFIKNFFTLLIGTIIAAIGLNVFLLPSKIAPGGVSGIASVIYSISGGFFPVGVTTIVLNIPLFIAGYIILGKGFTWRSILGTVMYSAMIDLISPVSSKLETFIHIESGSGTSLLYAIWGGVFLGLGLGMIFRSGATTGGTDIGARLLSKKWSWLTLGQLVLFLDILLLIVVAVAYKDILPALYTGIAVFISSKVIDAVVEGVNYAKAVYIISSEPEAISNKIFHTLRRGVTSLKATGMYSGGESHMLLCVIYNRQLPALRKLIDEIDKNAFIMISDIREVRGLKK